MQYPGGPVPPDHVPVQLPHERNQIRFLLLFELQSKHEVEELHRIFQRQAAAVVEIWRALFDAA